MKIQILSLGVSALALMWCGAAAAQEAAYSSNEGSGATSVQEVVVTAERRATNLQKTPIAATVLSGDDLAKKGVMTVDQLQFAGAERRDQQLRPGQRFQHPRHRQGRAQQPDHDRRHHLSRRHRHLPGLLPGRALLRHRQRRDPARSAGHLRRPERHRRRRLHHRQRSGDQRRQSRLHCRPVRQLHRRRRAGRGQSADQRHAGRPHRLQHRASRQLLPHHRPQLEQSRA